MVMAHAMLLKWTIRSTSTSLISGKLSSDQIPDLESLCSLISSVLTVIYINQLLIIFSIPGDLQ